MYIYNFHRTSLWNTLSEVSFPAPNAVDIPILRECRVTYLGFIPTRLVIWWRADTAYLYDPTRITPPSKYTGIGALSGNVLL